MTNEFRNRFATHGSGALNLLVEVGIQAEASHSTSVSHTIHNVIHWFESLRLLLLPDPRTEIPSRTIFDRTEGLNRR
jgi:hypothetical protein